MSAAPKVTARVYAPLDKFVPSPTQPRRRFTGIAELAASIAELGVIDDVHVRVRANGKLELVCGERRLRAAREAGLEELPFQVRELSDDDVIRVQLAEAREREDLHPLEEAEAFELARSRGLSVEDLRNGRPASYVYRRLALVQLSPTARDAFLAGRLTEGAAQALARITDPAQQNSVLEQALQIRGHEKAAVRIQDIAFYVDRAMLRLKDAPWKLDDPELHGGACTTCPKRTQAQAQLFEEKAAVRIQDIAFYVDRAMLRLKDAPWKLDDPELHGGACTTCPKRTQAQAQLFEEALSAEDECTDRGCFEVKRAEHSERLIELAKQSGAKAISKSETKSLMPHGHVNEYDLAKGGYVDLDGRGAIGAIGSPPKKWREVIADRAAPRFVAKHPTTGAVLELVRIEDVKKVLKAEPRKGDPKPPAKKPSSSSTKSSSKSKGAKAAKKADDTILVREAKHLAAQRITSELGTAISIGEVKLIDSIRYLAHDAASGFGYHEALERRGLKTDDKALHAFLSKANAGELLAFGIEITIREQLPIDTDRKVWNGPNARELIEAAGIDWLAIEQEEIAIARATPGTCRVCGCTEENACPEGCSWADDRQTLCSSCVPKKAPAKAPAKASTKKPAAKSAKKKASKKKGKAKK